MELWYKKPAEIWEAALPLGNGRFGAMVFGGVKNDIFQLNDITLWSGEPHETDNPEAYTYLPKIRELMRDENYAEAEKMILEHFTGIKDDTYFGSHTTMGEISVNTKHGEETTSYRRSLSLDEAVAYTDYCVDGVSYHREHFISAPIQTFVSRYTADKPASVAMDISYSRECCSVTLEGNDIVVTGKANDNGEMKFTVRIRVIAKGGAVTHGTDGKTLCVSGADEVLLLVAGGTDYIPDASVNFKREDPSMMVRFTLDSICADYEDIKKEHIADYYSYFGRLQLNLEGLSRDELTTDERLVAISDDNAPDDLGLVMTYFQFGRYLLICCSRPENMLPANLQGLWNKDMWAPWSADYHANINLQMNYWPAGPANLIECMDPLCRYTALLVENGTKTARAYYNADGWMAGLVSNAFGHTSPGAGAPWLQFSVAGAWLCTAMYEYYAFTQDERVLEYIYPVIRGSAVFQMQSLCEDKDGYLTTSPSASPENRYKATNGHIGWACEGATMDIMIIDENLKQFAELSALLGRDESLRAEIEAARARLRPIRVGKAGQLCEWPGDWDMEGPEMNHRHVSHLFGLHPGSMITYEKTPELMAAVRRSLEIRGDEGTGWALGWKINLRARLRDADHTYKHIRRILRYAGGSEGTFEMTSGGGTYTNMFDAHPPFQIDGNFGAAAGICELLLQSHRRYEEAYVLHLLPALPTVFATGSVCGLGARGAHTVDMTWKDGALLQATVTSRRGKRLVLQGTYDVTCNGETVDAVICDGLTVLDTAIGATYVVTPKKQA